MPRRSTTCATTARGSTWPTPTSCSAPSSGCTRPASSKARASVWPPCSGSCTATAGASGPRAPPARERRFCSLFQLRREKRVPLSNIGNRNGFVLLVEDNQDDEELAVLALQSAGLRLPIVVARDGAEAIDRLVGSGARGSAGRQQLEHQAKQQAEVDG